LHLLLPHPLAGAGGEKGRSKYRRREFWGPLSPWGERQSEGDFALSYNALIEQTLGELAAHLAQHIDMEALLKLAR
jgi:hypothetical protein